MKEKEGKRKKLTKKCHFCDREQDTWFLYDLNDSIDSMGRSMLPVCGIHFNKLCNLTYTTDGENLSSYLSAGQQEYVSVKKLERSLGITTHHK